MKKHLSIRPRFWVPALLTLVVLLSFGDTGIFSTKTRIGGATLCLPGVGPLIFIPGSLTDYEAARNVAHERVHAAQCRELGALRMNARILFSERGRLELEAPAFCAGNLAGDAWMGGFQPAVYDPDEQAIEALTGHYRVGSPPEVAAYYRSICEPMKAAHESDRRALQRVTSRIAGSGATAAAR